MEAVVSSLGKLFGFRPFGAAVEAKDTKKVEVVSTSDFAKRILAELQYVDFLVSGDEGIKETRKGLSEAIKSTNDFVSQIGIKAGIQLQDPRKLSITFVKENPNSDGRFVDTFFASVDTTVTQLTERGEKDKINAKDMTTKLQNCKQAYSQLEVKVSTVRNKALINGPVHPHTQKVMTAVQNHESKLKELSEIEEDLKSAFSNANTSFDDLGVAAKTEKIKNLYKAWKHEGLYSPEISARKDALEKLIPLLEMKKLHQNFNENYFARLPQITDKMGNSLNLLREFDIKSKTQKDDADSCKLAGLSLGQTIEELTELSENFVAVEKALLQTEVTAQECIGLLSVVSQNNEIPESVQGTYIVLAKDVKSKIDGVKKALVEFNELKTFCQEYGHEIKKFADFKLSCIKGGTNLRDVRLHEKESVKHFDALEANKVHFDSIKSFNFEEVEAAFAGLENKMLSKVANESGKEKVKLLVASGKELIASIQPVKAWALREYDRTSEACGSQPKDKTYEGDFRGVYRTETGHLVASGDVFGLGKKLLGL